MESCDVLIIGGGPAGSTCAWKLREAGLDVLVWDKSRFPRDKTCAGWITPQVVQSLKLDPVDYAQGRVFQPISGFRTSVLGHRDVALKFPRPVSYGIRRCEFDDYLLRRSGARCRLGEPVRALERSGGSWIVNGEVQAPMLVGAGGNFCPVARYLRSHADDTRHLVTAVEAEFPIGTMREQVQADPCTPQLFFCGDGSGYGWCVRKGDFLNIGLGLVNSKETSARLPELLELIKRRGVFSGEVPIRFHGHAYQLYDGSTSDLVDDGVVLIGDSAGLAYPQSGEGIRPAVESGLLAALAIQQAQGRYDRERLECYRRSIEDRFGKRGRSSSGNWLSRLPVSWQTAIVSQLLSNAWFSRRVVMEQWFLHVQQPALLV